MTIKNQCFLFIQNNNDDNSKSVRKGKFVDYANHFLSMEKGKIDNFMGEIIFIRDVVFNERELTREFHSEMYRILSLTIAPGNITRLRTLLGFPFPLFLSFVGLCQIIELFRM